MKASILTSIRLTCFASFIISMIMILVISVFGAFMINSEIKEVSQFALKLLTLSVVLYGLHYILDRFEIKFKGN